MRGFGLLIQIIGVLVMVLGALYTVFTASQMISPAIPFVLGLAIVLIGAGVTSSGEKQDFQMVKQTLEETNIQSCFVCGSKSFTWGNVVSYAPVRFRKSVGIGKPILARQCDQCGHIDLFTKTNAL